MLIFFDETNEVVKNNQKNNLNDKKLTNVNSITIKNNPTDDNHVGNKKYISNELDKNTILRFNQTQENYLKVSVGNDIYNLTKYDKIQRTDTTTNRYSNERKYLLQKWNIVFSDKNGNGKLNNIIKSTKTTSPTGDSGATTLPQFVIVLCL